MARVAGIQLTVSMAVGISPVEVAVVRTNVAHVCVWDVRYGSDCAPKSVM